MNRKILFTVLCLLWIAPLANAQEKKKSGFDVSKFLKRLDTNGNGKVEPGEIKDDRTRGFLRKAGVDPSKSISIAGFAKKIKKQRSERNSGSANSQQSPGFDVDRDEDDGNALSFSVTDEERAPRSSARTRQYSEGAVKMMEWTLKKYDKNKDGKLDENEIRSGRWSDPPAKDSDTNRDGQLSRNELLSRYQKREEKKEQDKKRSSRRSSSSSRSSKERSREESKTSSRRVSTRKTSESKSSGSGADREKLRKIRKSYESYVDGVFKKYDKDKNGQLSKDEIEEMRKKPEKGTDTDNDKQVSRAELLNSFLKKAGVSGSNEGSKSSSKSRNSSSKSSVRSSAAGGNRPKLTSKDKNENGQIEMSEFASEWTLAKVQEFYEKDKNRDGVITAAEWNAKK